MFSSFSKEYKNLKYLFSLSIYFNGNNKEYNLYKIFNLIAYNNKEVIICYIKPQFNNLNYNETLLNSIFDTFLIKNLEKMMIKNLMV